MKASFSTNTTGYLRKKIKEYWRATNQWFLETPERSLERAYKAALTIRAIEDKHFGGNKISAELTLHSNNVMNYLQADLEKNLSIIKLRLAEFKISRSVLSISNYVLLEKLRFIDEVIAKYTYKKSSSNVLVLRAEPGQIDSTQVNSLSLSTVDVINVETVSDKTGVLPRSIGRTINRIKEELAPKGEEEVVKKFRSSRAKTKSAVKFLLMLIIVPFLTQQLSKQFLVEPIVDRVRGENEAQIFVNFEMKEEALRELQVFEEEIRFDSLINKGTQLSLEAMEERVKHKATEIAEEFRIKSLNAVSNVFSDMLALLAFVFVIATSQREIIVLKSFMDDIVYGLSDSAKAFIIILFTDIFVGFHSPHGWEVILEGLAGHLGIAANKSIIFLFIATFPVILDTIFKYWIFRYLSRISPSAVATLRNMNE